MENWIKVLGSMYVTAANVAELWPIVTKQNGLSN